MPNRESFTAASLEGNQRRKSLNRDEDTLPWQKIESTMGIDMVIKAIATPEARAAARKAAIARADERAAALAPIVAEIQASGITTPYAMAADLTRRGIPTARGHRFWGTSQVRDLLNRLDRLAVGGRSNSHATPGG
jgi:hypothetical protein